MAIRGFIIAVQEYPGLAERLAGELDGTLASAGRFRDWLVNAKGAAPGNIVFCASPREKAPGATTGATRDEIRRALIKFREVAAGDTEELYFFFSGHGFAQVGLGRRFTGDAFLPADYEDPTLTGDRPIKHDEIVSLLQTDLGPGVHFHFIDACRNERREDQFPVGALAIPSKPMDTGQPEVHILYSTSRGDAARVDSTFAQALVDGLKGDGRAKTWWTTLGQHKLVVRFASLLDYVRARVRTQRPAPEAGDPSTDFIYEFRPPMTKRCEITVANAQPHHRFEMELRDAAQNVLDRQDFTGARHSFERLPNDYYISVVPKGAGTVNPSGPVPLDLYENARPRFSFMEPQLDMRSFRRMTTNMDYAPRRERRSDLRPAELNVRLPQDATAKLTSLVTGTELPLGEMSSATVPPGKYRLTVHDRDQVTVRQQMLDLAAGWNALDLTALPPGSLHAEILRAIPLGEHERGAIDLSESLHGPLQDQDPALWLAIMGAAHIVSETYDFSKLRHLPLADLSPVQPGQSALYVLVGLDEEVGPLHLALTGPANPKPRDWAHVTQVPGFQHLSQHTQFAAPGPGFVSLAVGEASVLTLATALLPNRATFITVTQDRHGMLQVQQMMLPIAHLLRELPPAVREEIPEFEGRPLRNVKFIVQAQRAFRKRELLQQDFALSQLRHLLDGKWLDPVMGALAFYELFRRGKRDNLHPAAQNLLRYFPTLPDCAAIARQFFRDKNNRDPSLAAIVEPLLAADPQQNGWPLFIDGLPAFGDFQKNLPFDAARLDYRGMWTMWRGAVRNPNR